MDDPPTIFKGSINAKQNRRFSPRYMFEIPSRDTDQDAVTELFIEDIIQNFDDFKINYAEKLGIHLTPWQVRIKGSYKY